ncbi:MAG TPA: aminomethyltransferase family protein [Nannocystaceae bacterium]|nr:aminomethyltransferase family protein [Nannocystaceae bacterium]
MPRFSPFAPRTTPLMEGQHWRRWAGYVTASSYELTHDREYAAIRNAAALIDVTPLYKYMVEGRDAARLLDRIVTRDVAKCKLGQVMYTPWCDADGKIIDDGTIARLGEQRFRMTSADPGLRWLDMNAYGMDVRISEVSESTAALSLQGPTSRAILQKVADGDVAALGYFKITDAKIRDVPITISRTGYTGDLGFELWIPVEGALQVWDALIEVGSDYGIAPCGIWAMDIARIEAGLLMAEVDYVSARHALIEGQKSTPFELGLGWAVALGGGPFIGKAALHAEKEAGPAWRFVGIDVDWESLEACYREVDLPPRLPSVAWRESVPLYHESVQVGYATSGCWSPLLKKYLALAHVEAQHGEPGTELMMEVTVEHRRKQALARVSALPFFDPPRKKGNA